MGETTGGALRSALGGMLFPLVPVALARLYYEHVNVSGEDPRGWDTEQYLVLLGPLIGFGFLAGATPGLPAGPARGRFRSLLARRWIWVGIGPWAGFLFWAAVIYGGEAALERWGPIPDGWFDGEIPEWLGRPMAWAFWGSLAYGWLPFALATLLGARRLGRLGATVRRGAIAALGFVGSLVGGFWAATSLWRGYFFDPRALPAIVLALVVLASAGGCAPQTLGELRRRELFEAMSLAWVVGLALLWRRWARPRPRPPGIG